MVPLSIREPSLFTSGQRAIFQGFSGNCQPPLWRRVQSLSSCKSHDNTKRPQQSYHQVYMHFSQPLRPISKVLQTVTHSKRSTTDHRGQQTSVSQYKQPLKHETLSVIGKPCLPVQPVHPMPSATSRTQLHVYLPAEGSGAEEDRDSVSVDEGFMDELDNKVTMIKFQQGEPKPFKQSGIVKSRMDDLVQITS